MRESDLSPQRQPFFYLAACLAAGIVAERFCEPARSLLLLLLVTAAATAVLFVARRKLLSATIALLVSFAFVGALLSRAEKANVAENRLQVFFDTGQLAPDDPVELTGVLKLPPEPAPDGFFLDVEAETLRLLNETTLATGRVRLIAPLRDETSAAEFHGLALAYGSRLRVTLRLERARSYRNPGSPDFQTFLERQGYDAKGTVKSPLLIEKLNDAPTNSVLAAIYSFRLRALAAIDARFTEPVAGTLKAMLLGNKYYLDAGVSERLRESATFHTLVISGFHISILAWFVLAVRIPFASRRRGDTSPRRPGIARISVALGILWAYTVMVGLAPPVTRATVMVSVGLFAPLLFRRAASVNTVSLAAFLMLVLKPALVADAGFQLSFLAVAGIVAVALPLLSKLKSIGGWRPTPNAPRPPACPRHLRAFAETLYWNEREFRREMKTAPITYRLEKSPIARFANRLRLQPALRFVVALFVTSLAIQFTTLPLMIYYFNRVAPVGILLNVSAGLLTAAMMFGAVSALVLNAVYAPLATPVAWLVEQCHLLLVNSVNPFAPLPWMTFRVAHYEGWRALVYVAYFLPLIVFVALLDLWRPVFSFRFSVFRNRESSPAIAKPDNNADSGLKTENRKLKSVVAVCAAVALFFSLLAFLRPPTRLPRGKLTVYFLDVGQGDAALVVFPQGATMLVDGGGEFSFATARLSSAKGEKMLSDADGNAREKPDEEPDAEGREPPFRERDFSIGEAVVSRFLWSLGLTHLDYVVATHSDADHLGGLVDVVNNFSIGEALIARVPQDSHDYNRFSQILTAKGIRTGQLHRGGRFEIEGVSLEILHPTLVNGTASKSPNNDSVVLRLMYGKTALLLTGDIEREAEEALVRSGMDLRADLMKVPHHGSRTSSTERFLNAAKPTVAVISVGERSRFGHPHAEVVSRYAGRDVRVLQTGRDGMVIAQTDGETLAVEPYRE